MAPKQQYFVERSDSHREMDDESPDKKLYDLVPHSNVPGNTSYPHNADDDEVDDLVDSLYLEKPNILHSLRTRLQKRNQAYTRVGPRGVLIFALPEPLHHSK